MIGLFVFVACMILFYKFAPNIEKQDFATLEDVYLDAQTLSDALTTTGYPENWTEDSVERIGLVSRGNIINETKLLSFQNLTLDDYENVKTTFNIRAEFVVFFTDKEGSCVNLSNVHHVGHSAIVSDGKRLNMSGIEHSNLAALTRIAVFNGSIVKVVVYTWS